MDANSTLSRVCTIVLGKGFPGSFQPLGAQETAGWADGCEDTGKTKLVTNSEIDSRPSSRGSHLPGRLSHRRGGSSSALSSCPSRETHLAPLASREMHVCVCVSEYVYVCVCECVCMRERERGCFLWYSHYWGTHMCRGRPGDNPLWGHRATTVCRCNLLGAGCARSPLPGIL